MIDLSLTGRLIDKLLVMPNGCWQWTASIGSHGYGQIARGGGRGPMLAHRASYEIFVGPIPDGLTLDHRCRNRACVNPSHLEPVTLAENKRRGMSPSAVNARKTHCQRGHEFTPENTYMSRNPSGLGRVCRECRRIRDRVK